MDTVVGLHGSARSAALPTTSDRRDWRSERVFGPRGYIGTVDECLAALAGGANTTVRAGLLSSHGRVIVRHPPAADTRRDGA